MDPFPPMAKVSGITTVFLDTGLLRFSISPKTQIKLCFEPKTPDCCLHLLFLPCGSMVPEWGVVCRVVTGSLTYRWALCARCTEPPPGFVYQT